MKKLVIAAAIVCATAIANAASYSWIGESYWVSADGENPLSAQVYLYDAYAVDLATVTAKLAKNDTSVLASALGNGSVDGDGIFSLSGDGLTDNGGTPPYASMAAILIASNGSNDYFYDAGTLSVKVTDAVIGGGASFAWGGDEGIVTGEVGGAGWTAMAAPEPTSGLLLLLGVAGLALRRRRA